MQNLRASVSNRTNQTGCNRRQQGLQLLCSRKNMSGKSTRGWAWPEVEEATTFDDKCSDAWIHGRQHGRGAPTEGLNGVTRTKDSSEWSGGRGA